MKHHKKSDKKSPFGEAMGMEREGNLRKGKRKGRKGRRSSR